MTGYTLEVGSPYDPARSSYRTAESLRIGRSTCELTRFWSSPSRAEVRAHESGEAVFALVDQSPDLLVLSYRFGDLDWSDTPFQAHRLTTAPQGWPLGGPASGVALTTVLVDSDTGVVRALRGDEWSPEFANFVRVGIAEQLIHEYDDTAAGRKLDSLYRRYSTPEEMVRAEAIAGCRSDSPSFGGDSPISINYY